MNGYSTKGPIYMLIEQAIARGESFDWIVTNLRTTPAKVDEALQRMDLANAEVDFAAFEPRPRFDRYASSGALLEPHGTNAAFARHQRRKEAPCEPCWRAHREFSAERSRAYRARKRKAA